MLKLSNQKYDRFTLHVLFKEYFHCKNDAQYALEQLEKKTKLNSKFKSPELRAIALSCLDKVDEALKEIENVIQDKASKKGIFPETVSFQHFTKCLDIFFLILFC